MPLTLMGVQLMPTDTSCFAVTRPTFPTATGMCLRNTDLIQNGADAVALYVGDGSDWPNDTPVTTDDLVDAIVYDTDDGDDAELLVLLNAGQPQVDEAGRNNGLFHSNQRCPNGYGWSTQHGHICSVHPHCGRSNKCYARLSSTRSMPTKPAPTRAEFVELYDGGVGYTNLSGLVLVLYNGSDDASYDCL